jgi:predicted component of type VI protein secretion system
LIEIETSVDGAYRVAPYIPPLLKISSFHAMKDICLQTRLTQLAVKLRRKAHQLAGITAGKEEGYGTVISEQHAHILRHMVGNLPQLEVLSFAGTAHPFDAFERLAALSGQLCSIGKSVVPPLLPRYNHEEMAQGFKQLLGFAEAVVDSVSLAYSSVMLTEQEDGTFSISFEKTWLSRKLLLEVTYASGQREEQVLNWIAHARVGSSSVLKVLSERRMPGAMLGRIQRDEQMGVTAKHNSLLFTLQNANVDVGDEKTPVIKPGQKLYLKGFPGKAVPASVVLHIANEANEQASAN